MVNTSRVVIATTITVVYFIPHEFVYVLWKPIEKTCIHINTKKKVFKENNNKSINKWRKEKKNMYVVVIVNNFAYLEEVKATTNTITICYCKV